MSGNHGDGKAGSGGLRCQDARHGRPRSVATAQGGSSRHRGDPSHRPRIDSGRSQRDQGGRLRLSDQAGGVRASSEQDSPGLRPGTKASGKARGTRVQGKDGPADDRHRAPGGPGDPGHRRGPRDQQPPGRDQGVCGVDGDDREQRAGHAPEGAPAQGLGKDRQGRGNAPKESPTSCWVSCRKTIRPFLR